MPWAAKRLLVVDGKTYQADEIIPHAMDLAGFPLMKAMHRVYFVAAVEQEKEAKQTAPAAAPVKPAATAASAAHAKSVQPAVRRTK